MLNVSLTVHKARLTFLADSLGSHTQKRFAVKETRKKHYHCFQVSDTRAKTRQMNCARWCWWQQKQRSECNSIGAQNVKDEEWGASTQRGERRERTTRPGQECRGNWAEQLSTQSSASIDPRARHGKARQGKTRKEESRPTKKGGNDEYAKERKMKQRRQQQYTEHYTVVHKQRRRQRSKPWALVHVCRGTHLGVLETKVFHKKREREKQKKTQKGTHYCIRPNECCPNWC